MKLYHKHDLFNDYVANLKQPDHFILYIISSNVSRMNISLKINMTNYCPYTYSLMCFHDDHYYCLCDMYDHAECFRYNSTLDECNGRCRANMDNVFVVI
jgi:hypothetical protein